MKIGDKVVGILGSVYAGKTGEVVGFLNGDPSAFAFVQGKGFAADRCVNPESLAPIGSGDITVVNADGETVLEAVGSRTYALDLSRSRPSCEVDWNPYDGIGRRVFKRGEVQGV